jgi:hypothetical protein
MWLGHTFGPASLPGIHQSHLSVRTYSRERPLREELVKERQERREGDLVVLALDQPRLAL